ncbi:MAG: CmcJ/NvfI family oxidoreductase [Gammaproteobacteria bacterium]|nr:CmcJ/NvfI family oxidoreductase [Gammaproteobacteria bacterium]
MTSEITSQAEASHHVTAKIKYVVKGEHTIFYPGDREKSYWPGEMRDMEIKDLHSLPEAELPTVKKNGFALLRHDTQMSGDDYFDEKKITQIYYPEMCELAKQVNGATKSIAFGHVARSDKPDATQHSQPSYAAHVDYGRKTIEEYAYNILGDEAETWLKKRVVLMNFWRPIKVIHRTPLALVDASTVTKNDLNFAEVRGGLNDPNRPPLYGWNLSFNPDHLWYYAFEMQPEEIFAFKLYDSNESVPQYSGHTAIDLPWTDENTPPRHSMEIRTISFIEE